MIREEIVKQEIVFMGHYNLGTNTRSLHCAFKARRNTPQLTKYPRVYAQTSTSVYAFCELPEP